MPILTEKTSKVLGTRYPLDLVERIEDFAAESSLTVSGAIRVLVELGLGADVDLRELKALSYNARAEALQLFERRLLKAVEAFQKDTQ